MADLFVSYSREDKARAAEIVQLLEDHGWDVFWDQETRAGMLWPKVLEEELVKARCLVALWTTTSIDSRWVRIEAYEALQNEKLVPVLLDKVRPPLEFRQTQTFDLIGWKGDRNDPRLSQLLVDLTVLAKAPGSHGPVQRPIQIAVPTTLRREMREAPHTGDDDRGAAPVPKRFAPVARVLSRPSRNWLLGGGVAAAVIAIAWGIAAIDFSPAPSTPLKVTTTPPVEVATPAPGPAQPLPDAPAPAKKTEVAVVPVPAPPISKPSPKPPQRLRSARCLAIEEKFQQTGQITAAERDFLRGKECQ